MTPLVSVIIPTRNRASLLRETLNSVLCQEYGAREIIVIDDGSEDGTGELCREFPVHYVRTTQRGRSAARNAGASAAAGDLLAFLDDDDLWPERSLSLRVRRWEEDPECHHLVGRVRRFRVDSEGDVSFLDDERQARHMVGVGAGVMLRKAFFAAGGFDESLSTDEDTDLWFRMKAAGMRLRMIPEICLHYRRHEGNTTSSHEEIDGQHASLLRSLRRKIVNNRLSGATIP